MNFLSITRKGIKISILSFICLWFVQINVSGQTSIATIGSTVSQNFDGLINSGSTTWTSGTTLPVWHTYLTGVVPTDPTVYYANDGSTGTSGRLNSFGTTSASDRALGLSPGGAINDISYVGWRLVNNTGKTLKELKVNWTAEQWRVTASSQQVIRLYYKINSFDLSTPGTEVGTLNSPKFGLVAAALDGNDAANRVSTQTTINLGVGLPNGSEITLIWGVAKQASANQLLAIDDISVKARAAQDINVTLSLPAFTYGNSSVDLNSYFSANSGLTLSYSSSNTNVAQITGGNTLNIVGPGSFTIYADQAGDVDYIAATQNSQNGTVKPQTPVLNPTSSITTTSFNTSWTINNGSNDAGTTYFLQYAGRPDIQDAIDNSEANSNEFSGIVPKNYNITGLTANQLYHYRVFATNSGLYSGYSQSLTVTTGSDYISDQDGDWDTPVNWDVNISSPNPYGNSVTINTEITAFNTARDSIVVNKLVITQNGKLNNQEIIHVTGDLIIMSDINGKTGQILNSNSLRMGPTSRVILRKKFGPNSTHGWYFMGFPYNVTEAQSFIGSTNTAASWGNNFAFEAAKNYYVIRYDGQQRDATGLFNGTSGLNWKDASTKTFASGVGYSITVPNDTTIDFVIPHAQKGNIFASSGTRSVTQYTTNGSNYHHSWNLITSPLASAYNLASTPSQAPYYVWNRLTQSYDVKMPAESYKVYPYEAFFLQAQSGSMSFVDGGRSFKVGAVSNAGSFDELKISISNATLSDLTRIRFEEGASDEYVIGKDAAKFISDNTNLPQIYSHINGKLVAVNTLPSTQKVVDLLTKTGQTGNFTIRLDNKNSLANFASVKLIDSKTSTVTELLTNDYNFTEDNKSEVSRFKISVVYQDASAVNTIGDLGISVDVSSNKAVINGLSSSANIQLFDMAGKLIYTANQIRDGYVIDLKSKGVFFLNITTESGNNRLKLMNN
jgi:hypothetical protein